MSSKDNQSIPNPTAKDIHEGPNKNIFAEIDSAISKKTSDTSKVPLKIPDSMRTEKLAYMAEMLVELHKLANAVDEKMVAYLIEMAILELHTVRSTSSFSGDLSEMRKTKATP